LLEALCSKTLWYYHLVNSTPSPVAPRPVVAIGLQ